MFLNEFCPKWPCTSEQVSTNYVCLVTGEGEAHHPEPWEVVFTSEFSERPPAMTWRYPEPRALSAVDMVPLPLSTPVLVNTLNMGDEYQVSHDMLKHFGIILLYVVYTQSVGVGNFFSSKELTSYPSCSQKLIQVFLILLLCFSGTVCSSVLGSNSEMFHYLQRVHPVGE